MCDCTGAVNSVRVTLGLLMFWISQQFIVLFLHETCIRGTIACIYALAMSPIWLITANTQGSRYLEQPVVEAAGV